MGYFYEGQAEMLRSLLFVTLLLGFSLAGVSEVSAKQVSNVQERTEMSFGTILVDPNGDMITLSPSGSISAQGSSIISGAFTAGEFRAQGDKYAAVSISFSAGDILTGPGSTMALGSFTHNAGAAPAFDNTGKIQFNVGATLTINAPQYDGLYSGTYTIFIDYP